MSSRSGGVTVAASTCISASATIAATGRLWGGWLRRCGRVHHTDRHIVSRYPCLANLYNFDRKLCIGGTLRAGLIMRIGGASQTVNVRLLPDTGFDGALCAGRNTCVGYNSLTAKIRLAGGAGIVGSCLTGGG